MFHPRLCKCKNSFKTETERCFLPTWLSVRKKKKKKLRSIRSLNTVTIEKNPSQLNILMAPTRDISPTYTDPNWNDLRCQSISPGRCQAASCY